MSNQADIANAKAFEPTRLDYEMLYSAFERRGHQVREWMGWAFTWFICFLIVFITLTWKVMVKP